MRVKILKTWRRLKPGTEANIPDGAANVLVRRGFVEEVRPVKRKRSTTGGRHATQDD